MISGKQFCFITICFIQSSLMNMMYLYRVADNEAWIAHAFGFLLAFVPVLIYVGLYNVSGGLSLFDVNECVYGRVGGRLISVVYILYYVFLAAFNLREAIQFVAGDLMVGLSGLVAAVILAIPCAYTAKKGIKALAGGSVFVTILVYALTLMMLFGLTKYYNIENLLPVFKMPFSHYLQSTHVAFMLPFSELIALPALFHLVNSRKITKSFLTGFVVGSLFLEFLVFVNTLVLGPFAKLMSYPPYEITRLVEFSSAVARIEILFALPILYMLFFRGSLLILSSSIGTARLFGTKNAKVGIYALTSLVILFSVNLSSSNVELLDSMTRVLPFYALIPQMILPLATLCLLAIPSRRKACLNFGRCAA